MTAIANHSTRHAELMGRNVLVQRLGRTVAGRIVDTVDGVLPNGETGATFVAISPRAAQDVAISGEWINVSEVTFENAPVAAPVVTAPVKEIKYNHGDYDMYLDGEYVGSEASYHTAEIDLDRLAYERLDRAGIDPQLTLSATALDGGSSVEEIAAEYAEKSLTTAIRLDGQTTTRQHTSSAKRDEYLRYNPSARIVAVLPIANFRPTIARPLWDQGYTSPNLPDNARGFCFTVDACPICRRLLNHSIYANPAGAWLAYDWCLECDRGRLAGQSCSGMQSPCNRPATQHIYSNATGMIHLCDAHAAEWQSCDPDDTPADDHNLVTPDPAECPSTTESQPVEDCPACATPDDDEPADDDENDGDWPDGLDEVLAPSWPVSSSSAPCFILPTGTTARSIILCVGGVSRVVSAQGVAEALTLASVHAR